MRSSMAAGGEAGVAVVAGLVIRVRCLPGTGWLGMGLGLPSILGSSVLTNVEELLVERVGIVITGSVLRVSVLSPVFGSTAAAEAADR